MLKRSSPAEQTGRRINLTFRWFNSEAVATEERKRKREAAEGGPPPSSTAAAATRVELDCPYAEKDEAKRLGAQWDAERRVWWVPPGVELAPFARWLPQ